MIRLLLIAGLVIISRNVNSQNALLLDTMKTWSVIQYNANMNYYGEHSHKIRINGDTLIDSFTYQKVWINKSDDDKLNWRCESFIRDDNGKIFYKKRRRRDEFYKEHLLYDFNAQVGDTFSTLTTWKTRTRIKIDSIFYSNIFGDSMKTWKVLLFNNLTSDKGQESYWYEGIGSEKGLLYPGEIVLHSGMALLCYKYGDSLVYRRKGYKDCFISVGTNEMNNNMTMLYPNPAQETITLEVPFDKFRVEIMTVTGQVVYENMTTNQKSIDISTWKKGNYIVKIIHDNGLTTKHLMKI